MENVDLSNKLEMTIWLYKSFGFRILTEITPMSFLCETVFIQMWFDCLLREQFLQALSSWKENCFLGPKKKQPVHSASACWAIAGLARNRSSSCGASWVLLTSEWTSVGLTVPPWRPHSAGPLGLLPGPGEHLGVASSLRAGSWGLWEVEYDQDPLKPLLISYFG